MINLTKTEGFDKVQEHHRDGVGEDGRGFTIPTKAMKGNFRGIIVTKMVAVEVGE